MEILTLANQQIYVQSKKFPFFRSLVVIILFKTKFEYTQISVLEIGTLKSKTACINPSRHHHGWHQLKSFSKFAPPDPLKMHSLALSTLRFLTFSNYLCVHDKTLFRGLFLKYSYIQTKNWYGYKLVRAVKQSKLKKCSKYYTRNHMKQCKLFT